MSGGKTERFLTNLTNRYQLIHTRAIMQAINLYEAKSHLSELVERASRGEEIVIAKAGKPKARLVPLEEPQRIQEPIKLGQNVLGVTYVAPDFYDDLPAELFDRPIEPEDV